MAKAKESVALDDTGKLVLDDQYGQIDPRLYYNDLQKWDYCIPGAAQPSLEGTIKALRKTRQLTKLKVLDIGCSYGINAALQRTSLTLDDLYTYYADPAFADLSPEEMLQRDIPYYREHVTDPDLEVVGLDVSARAIRYAVKAGLLDDGVSENLEENRISPEAIEAIHDVDLIMSTGAIGYVTEKSMAQVLKASSDKRPWMAHFVLRMMPYEPTAELLTERGYVTERLPGTFPQRRFASQEERDNVFANLQDRGLDPAGKESEGLYHSEFFLSRPADEVEAVPLETIATAPFPGDES